MELGFFLKSYRERMDLSGRQLAEKLGVSKFSLDKWENAGTKPKHDDSLKIMNYFGLEDLNQINDTQLDKCSVQATPATENLLALKDQLIAEKEKRIRELENIIALKDELIKIQKELITAKIN